MLEAELFAFLEKTADAAFAVTREGQICSWNQAADAPSSQRSSEPLTLPVVTDACAAPMSAASCVLPLRIRRSFPKPLRE